MLCSDGVWDAISHEEVAEIVRAHPLPSATAAARGVVAAAVRARGLRDDITCAMFPSYHPSSAPCSLVITRPLLRARDCLTI